MTECKYYLKAADIHDYNYFYAGEPRKESGFIAFVLMKNNKRLAIGGFWLRQSAVVTFVRCKEEIPKKFFLREVKNKFQEMASQATVPVYAVRDATIKNSASVLKKFGFNYYCTTPENEEIFKL